MKSDFEIAITQLCSDRNLSPEVILEAIEAALISAYKRNYGANQNVNVTLDPHTGQARVFITKQVAEEVEDDGIQMTPEAARTIRPDAQVGEFVDIELKPRNFGRIAAQTAKQVIMQRIREAERDSVYLEYADRAGEIVNGVIRNIDSRSQNVTLSLGKAEALLPRSEQIPGEQYRFNQRLRVYVVEVERTGHGPQITVSRTHRGLLRRLLELEVPEVYNGAVEVKAIAREAGSRSKVAVAALQPGVDPVGSCVGMRGVRIQNVVNELSGEKIDVVPWAQDVQEFIGNALSPAKVVSVYLTEDEKTAKVVVPDRALSLAIGREGQNARLAAKLTGWRIDIRSETEAAEEAERLAAEALEAAQRAEAREEARRAAAELLAAAEAALEDEEIELETAELSEEEFAPGLTPPPVVEGEVAEEAEPILAEADTAAAEEELAPLDAEAEVAPELTEEAEALETAEAAEIAEVAEEAEPVAAEPEAKEPAEEWPAPEYAAEEGTEGDDEERRRARDKKSKQRVLEFDERLGRVVARKKRKPSRRGAWDADDESWS
jgi:transcription termination/antitermination protein NusA